MKLLFYVLGHNQISNQMSTKYHHKNMFFLLPITMKLMYFQKKCKNQSAILVWDDENKSYGIWEERVLQGWLR